MRASASQFKVIRTGNPFLLLLLLPIVLVVLVFFALIMAVSALSGTRRRKAVPANASPTLAKARPNRDSAASRQRAIEAEFHHIPN